MYVCYEYSKVLKWKLWMCRMDFQKKICQKFRNELCIWGTRLKIPLFWGAYFNGDSTFVVSNWETPQVFTEPLQDPAPSSGNTNFPISWPVLTKLQMKMCHFGHYPGNFDQNPQMTKYRQYLDIWGHWEQNSEKLIYASLQHGERLFNL